MSSLHELIQFSLEQGIPVETLRFLLLLPFVVTLIGFFRQVVGIKSFGIYAPTLIVFSFLEIGIKYGIAIYVSVIVVGSVTRFFFRKLRILSISRVAITLTIISLVLFFLLLMGASFQRTGFATVSIVPLIIMIVISEKFISAQIEKNTRFAFFLSAQTLIISLLTFFLVQISFLTEILFRFPWVILFTVPLNIFFGRWTGLRIVEYFRFRSLFKNS